MTRRRLLAVLAVLLGLVLAGAMASLFVSIPGDAQTRLELDDDTDLTRNATIETYERDGVVSVDLDRVDATVTVADTHDQADLDGTHADVGVTYVCLDYREGLDRTLRVHIPDEMVNPRAAELTPVEGDGPTATLASARNGSATAVTLTVTEPGRYCYAAGALRGATSQGKSWIQDLLGNTTGISLPSLSGSSAEWTHLNKSAFRNASTVTIPATADAIQYDRDPAPGEPAWVDVPGCEDGADQAVCRLGFDNETMLKASDPRDVRYREQPTGPIEGLQSSVEDAMQAAEDAIQAVEQRLSEVF